MILSDINPEVLAAERAEQINLGMHGANNRGTLRDLVDQRRSSFELKLSRIPLSSCCPLRLQSRETLYPMLRFGPRTERLGK
jgi:hypothetical protein